MKLVEGELKAIQAAGEGITAGARMLLFKAHHAFLNYRPGPTEVQISRALEKAIRRSEVVDRESLCILAGQKVHFAALNQCCSY